MRDVGWMQENSSIAVARWWGDHTCTMASRSIYTDGTHGVGAGNGVKGGGSLLSRSFLLFTLSTVRYRARRPRCGNQQLESRVRENRQHGSEGGEAKAFPTPIEAGREDPPDLADAVAFALRLHAEAMVAAEIAAAPCRRETRARGRPRAAQPECEATGTASGRVAKLTTAETTTLTINAAKPMLMSLALAGRNGNRLTKVLWEVNVT